MSDENPIDKDWQNCDYEIKEQDRYLPIANVGRVMKSALPNHAKLSKESKECIQECVSEFISFITSQASDKCKLEKRKTLNGEDILWSMYTLGFENYSETLKIYLAKYRQFEQEQAIMKQPKKKSRRKPMKYDNDESSEDLFDEFDEGTFYPPQPIAQRQQETQQYISNNNDYNQYINEEIFEQVTVNRSNQGNLEYILKSSSGQIPIQQTMTQQQPIQLQIHQQQVHSDPNQSIHQQQHQIEQQSIQDLPHDLLDTSQNINL
ncbi:unnamed protein product [Candida verbasci]|uniref:Transcription factor CBF/NF-Y/archaeal histone domain-containing protein n=1 Tax=Candida verbasci TaxID=1227364 RepID=A0A9W4TYI2_9ASCO|nr:unnamed protein product [Candida verbasci]